MYALKNIKSPDKPWLLTDPVTGMVFWGDLGDIFESGAGGRSRLLTFPSVASAEAYYQSQPGHGFTVAYLIVLGRDGISFEPVKG